MGKPFTPIVPALRLQILGPPRVWRESVELDTGPRQQTLLLAVLLARQGRLTSSTELVELIWGTNAPPSALNVLHKYIGALRRLLDPALAPRESGAHLLRRGTGYLFTAGPDDLDLVDFRRLVGRATAALDDRRPDLALECYENALALWQGPAGDGVDMGPVAIPIFTGLNDEFFDICRAAAELAIELGRPERVLAPLHLAARIAPLNEAVQAALVTALGAAGRQVEALSVFHSVRTRLADDLGLDPGPTLEAAQQQVLAGTATPALKRDGVGLPDNRIRVREDLVGRTDELAVLRRALEPVYAGGSGLVIVEGEPGAGKTRVLHDVAADARARGALVVWGRCLHGDGTPSMWPWVEAVGALVAALPPGLRQESLNDELGRLIEPRDEPAAGFVFPDSGGQFRLFERVVTVTGELSAHRPVLVVIDDLHWADVASLQLFAHLASRLPDGTAVIGALRDRAPTPGTELAQTLAAVSRVSGHRRIVLGPLGLDAVTELVRRETGYRLEPGAARSIHTRTGGNAFFVRELSRFLADSGDLSEAATVRAAVPATVRDVVRDRLSGLDGPAESLLQIAALLGRDVRLMLLARVAELDVQCCLAHLERLTDLGLLEVDPADPHALRFTHDLIRESVMEITTPRLTARLHLRIADALDAAGSDDESAVERLAYHLWSAGPLADAERTAGALVRAGSRAATKSALEAAERQLRSAVLVAREARLAELELSALSQLTAVVGMRAMYGTASLNLLERAEQLARTLGRDLEAAGFLFSRWTAHAQAIELERSGPLARRLFDQGSESEDPVLRTYGLQAWGLHHFHIGRIGEAHRYMSQSRDILLAGVTQRAENPVLADLQLLMIGMLAEITALHGDVASARKLLDVLESVAGDDPYRITVWATMVARTASVVGDPQWASRAAARGIAADPGFSFVFLGTYQRLARSWATAVTKGQSPETDSAIADAQRIIAANLLDPPRSCVSTWYALLAEMHVAAGSLVEAETSLDRAEFYQNAFGQRSSEGLILLLRARLLRERRETEPAVRAAADAARGLSIERGARLFARRAEELVH